jgi:uncharacterized protein
MWSTLIEYFRRYPAQERIVRLMIQMGLRIHDHEVYCGPIRLTDTALARAAGVDRRIVTATVKTIVEHPELSRAFTRFRPTLHLKEAAPAMGWGVVEIEPENADSPGILSGVSSVISQENISIRQAIVDDPDFIEEPKLFVVTHRQLPAHLIPQLRHVPGVRSVTVY